MNQSFYEKHHFLFWQPPVDWFKIISQKKFGHLFLVVFNYLLWIFLFYISYLLIKSDINIFWQLFTATIISEIIEKALKSRSFWIRPLHLRQNSIPNGFLKSWYQKGSFPSGHMVKITFFLMFLLHHPHIFNPFIYLLITLPLAYSRVFLGLHYFIDLLGGLIIGFFIWILVNPIQFPQILNQFILPIFNFIFGL